MCPAPKRVAELKKKGSGPSFSGAESVRWCHYARADESTLTGDMTRTDGLGRFCGVVEMGPPMPRDT